MILDLPTISSQIISWRRQLHATPETGLFLPKTRELICKELEKMGIPYTLHKETSSIVALIEGNHPGKTFALRCDIDALPIKEETGLPFASTNGNMHACGHDAHCAIMLGVAKILCEDKEQLFGNVKLLFQAGEEGHHGAAYMVKEGALDNPKVDSIIALHVVATLEGLSPGEVGLKSGPIMAGNYVFEVTVKSSGGHISDIANIANPVTVVSKIAMEIDQLQKQLTLQNANVVLGVGIIEAGRQENIVPNTARLVGGIRFHDKMLGAEVKAKLESYCDEASRDSRVSCSVAWPDCSDAVVNDLAFTQEIFENASAFNGINTVFLPNKSMVSEDVYHFFNEVPGSYIHLCCGYNESQKNKPLHTSTLVLNEDVFINGSVFMAKTALQWLNRNHSI